jgi:hypothetical protein
MLPRYPSRTSMGRQYAGVGDLILALISTLCDDTLSRTPGHLRAVGHREPRDQHGLATSRPAPPTLIESHSYVLQFTCWAITPLQVRGTGQRY